MEKPFICSNSIIKSISCDLDLLAVGGNFLLQGGIQMAVVRRNLHVPFPRFSLALRGTSSHCYSRSLHISRFRIAGQSHEYFLERVVPPPFLESGDTVVTEIIQNERGDHS